MAKHRHRHQRHHFRSNPSILFGQSPEELAAMAGGLALTGAVNEQLAKPLTRSFAPSGKVTGSLFDAGTTAASAMLSGAAVGMLSRPIGHEVAKGGWILAMGRALGAVIPGLGISSTFPQIPGLSSFGALGGGAGKAASTPAAALPSGAATPALSTIGARSAGF